MSILRVLIVVFSFVVSAQATSVIPPTFDELVRESELIFRGRVTAVRSGWSEAGVKLRIATWVTIAVERTLRGEAGAAITLEFMGGEVGERRMEVAGWPRFEVGDRGIFFVENRQGRMCPLVRLRHGRYRIVREESSAVEGVVRDDYSPVEAATNFAVPLAERNASPSAAARTPAIALAACEALIASRSALLPRMERAAR